MKKETGHQRDHLERNASDYFNKPAAGPDDAIAAPPWFLEALTRIAKEVPTVPTKSAIVFENTLSAAASHGMLLESFGFDMGRLIAANSKSTLGYGSEFWTVSQLKPLVGSHPNFGKLSTVLKSGLSFIFEEELEELTKSSELQKLLTRGNHKSAQEFEDKVSSLIMKDVTHGFLSRSLLG